MKWISVNDRLPENELTVIMLYEDSNYEFGCYIEECEEFYSYDERKLLDNSVHYKVTHWVYFPDFPKEDTDE